MAVVGDTADFGCWFSTFGRCDARELFSVRTRTSEMSVNTCPKERLHHVLLGFSTELEDFRGDTSYNGFMKSHWSKRKCH